MNDFFARTRGLLGEERFAALQSAKILLVGVGGVGGHTAEFLIRSGIGQLTVMDGDRVEETNVNRQAVANSTTLGRFKTEVAKELLLKINPSASIRCITEFFGEANVSTVFSEKYDFVLDAIDSVDAKVLLIRECVEKGIPILSAMGAGNRFGLPRYTVTDIYRTQNDGLAKRMRKRLRECGIQSLPCVVCDTPADKSDGVPKSISYHPAAAATVMAAYAVNFLTGDLP
mgnify:CR=1 FL=1